MLPKWNEESAWGHTWPTNLQQKSSYEETNAIVIWAGTLRSLFILTEDSEDERRRYRDGERPQGSENLPRLAGDGGDDQSAEGRVGEETQSAENQAALYRTLPMARMTDGKPAEGDSAQERAREAEAAPQRWPVTWEHY